MAKASGQGESVVAIEIPRVEIGMLLVNIGGDSPLICHQWSEKARKQMLDKQMKRARQAKEAKDPEAEWKATLYQMPEGSETEYGFPSVAFKSAAVSACRYVDGLPMTVTRGAFHVQGEYCPVFGDPEPREDMVRVGMGTADIRYRAQFTNWRTRLHVTYNKRAITPEQIINLFNVAGFGVGIGEWRPEKSGSFGRFHVDMNGEMA